MTLPPVVYIAGPFSADLQIKRAINILNAVVTGAQVARFGCAPLIPHANTGELWGTETPEFWYEATLALLSKADGAVFIPGWKNSKGSINEFEHCLTSNTPFVCLDDVPTTAQDDLLKDFCNCLLSGHRRMWCVENELERLEARKMRGL